MILKHSIYFWLTYSYIKFGLTYFQVNIYLISFCIYAIQQSRQSKEREKSHCLSHAVYMKEQYAEE